MCFLFTMLDSGALPKAGRNSAVCPDETWLCQPRYDPPPGGARRDRTDDLMLAKHALSQLSYGPF